MRKLISEFIGTLVLVLVACGVAVTGGSHVAIALAFGLVIVAMAYSIGNVSGCHINPAVSIAMLVSGRMSKKDFIGYVIAQVAGALVGAGILAYLTGQTESLGANGLFQDNVLKSLVVEIILTFIFVIAILGVTSKKENSNVAGIVIGLSLTLVHLIGIPLTGTSVNPARSIGPAIFVGGDALTNVWVFIVGPLVGGVLAALAYKFLTGKEAEA